MAAAQPRTRPGRPAAVLAAILASQARTTDAGRFERGAALALQGADLFTATGLGRYAVRSESGRGTYAVDVLAGDCTCRDHQGRGTKCKHLVAVSILAQLAAVEARIARALAAREEAEEVPAAPAPRPRQVWVEQDDLCGAPACEEYADNVFGLCPAHLAERLRARRAS